MPETIINSHDQALVTPAPRDYLIECGKRYWPQAEELILALPCPCVDKIRCSQHIMLSLPSWAADIGVGQGKSLLVDESCLTVGDGPDFMRCDWFAAAYHHLYGVVEREEERRQGPLHSYALRIKNTHPLLFEHAWANRIFLFLRRWAARIQGADEQSLFGHLPNPSFILTHDVDAVAKTLPIRLKQVAFHGINALRYGLSGQLRACGGKLARAAGFAFSRGDYWRFAQIMGLEDRAGRRSIFNFYAATPNQGKGVRGWLMDPSYVVGSSRLRDQLREMHCRGWDIGLHPSFASWADAALIAREKAVLEEALGHEVNFCRQHWLRFSWQKTWAAQAAAGLEIDSTLGFNDRPGFRNGCALRFIPHDIAQKNATNFSVIPLIMMDSHLYDYKMMGPNERRQVMEQYLGEVKAVGGEAALLWHQRVFDPDYGWGEGYQELLGML